MIEIYETLLEVPEEIDGLVIYETAKIIGENFYGLHVIFEEDSERIISAVPLHKVPSCVGFVQYVYEAMPVAYYNVHGKIEQEGLCHEFRGMPRGFIDEYGCFHYTYSQDRKLTYPVGVAFLPHTQQ